MKLSIIIPTLNEWPLVAKRIEFLYQHADKNNLEIIVVNSCDSSLLPEKEIKGTGAKYLESKISNRATQMNQGFYESTGHCVAFLHADVQPPITYYNDIIEALETSEYGWFCYDFDSNDHRLKRNAKFTRRNGWFAGGGDQIHFFNRTFFESYGPYDERCEIMEDFELTRKLRRLNLKPNIIKNPALVSARKYKHNSYFRVSVVNLMAMILFYSRVPTAFICVMYRKLLSGTSA